MAAFAQTMKVFFFASDPAGLLTALYDRIRIEQSDDQGATWTALTDASTHLRIEAGKYNYWFIVDGLADSTSSFRAVLTSTAPVPPADVPQTPSQAIDTSFEAVLTIEQLKAIYLYGVDLTEDHGLPYPDELYAHYIRAAISQVEFELDMKLLPTKIVAERHDFYRRDYESFVYGRVKYYPAISIDKVALRYPNGATVIEFPPEWINADLEAGQFQVYPANGVYTNAFISAGGGYLPLIYGGANFLPGLIQVDYVAGFPLGRIPPTLVELVGMHSSFGPFNTAGDLIAGAGIATKSLSIDGLSESVGTTSSATNAGYGARLLIYRQRIRDLTPTLRRYYKGLRLTAV
jgi:hypothetical protein